MIAALSDRARRPVEELALDLRRAISSTRGQLQRLIDHGVVDMSIDFHPERTSGPIALSLVRARPDADQLTLMKELGTYYGPRLLLYGELADRLAMMVWSKDPGQQAADEMLLANRPSVDHVNNYVLQSKVRFVNWVDQLSRAELPGVMRPLF